MSQPTRQCSNPPHIRRYVRIATNQLQFAGCILLPSPAAAQKQRARPPDHGAGICVRPDALLARSLPGGRIYHVSPWRDWLVPTRDKAAARSVPFGSPNGRKGAVIRTLSSAPGRDPDAGSAAQQFTSWPTLTSMRPGQRPFRVPLSDYQRPQFSIGGRIFRGPAPARRKDMPPSGSRPRTGAATARANIGL